MSIVNIIQLHAREAQPTMTVSTAHAPAKKSTKGAENPTPSHELPSFILVAFENAFLAFEFDYLGWGCFPVEAARQKEDEFARCMSVKINLMLLS